MVIVSGGGEGTTLATVSPQHPPPVEEGLDAGRWNRIAAGVIAAQLVFRAVLISRSYYVIDDFRYLTRAVQKPFFAYLFQDYQGHLMPGQFLLVWVHQQLFPGAYWPAAVLTLALQCLAAVMVWRLVRELVGAGPASATALVVYVAAPLTINMFLWYAAALQSLPLQIAMAGSLLHFVRWNRRRRRGDAVAVVGWCVFGMVMWEKGAIVPLLLALVSALWFAGGRGLGGVVRTWWRDRILWAVLAALALLEVVLYLSITGPEDRGRGAPFSAYFLVAREVLLSGVVPYLVGGPFGTAATSWESPLVPHGGWYLAIFVMFVAATLARRSQAWRAWTLFAVYLGFNVVTTTSTRWYPWSLTVGRASRYFADAAVVLAFVIAAALRPPAEVCPPGGKGRRLDGVVGTVAWRVVGGALVCLFLTASAVSSVASSRWSPASGARAYIEHARHDLAELQDPVVLDGLANPDLLGPDTVSELLTSLPRAPRFDAPTAQLLRVEPDGHVVPFDFPAGVDAALASAGSCGLAVHDGEPGVATFPATTMPWHWLIRIDYSTDADAVLEVTAGGVTQRAVVREGSHSLYLVVNGAVGNVRIASLAATAPVCVARVQIASGTSP
jgi:hypothetical protein